MNDNQSNNSNTVSNDSANDVQVYMLTTLDNPYNPFIDFDKWFAYDEQKAYHTCSYLAHVAMSSEELSKEDEILVIQRAIDEIIQINVTGNYVKVTQESWTDRSQSVPKQTSEE